MNRYMISIGRRIRTIRFAKSFARTNKHIAAIQSQRRCFLFGKPGDSGIFFGDNGTDGLFSGGSGGSGIFSGGSGGNGFFSGGNGGNGAFVGGAGGNGAARGGSGGRGLFANGADGVNAPEVLGLMDSHNRDPKKLK